jgi:hypothetical protein
MTNTDSIPATDAALTAEVTATGTASTRPSYEITPELRPHADAILAMDPVDDVPPPYEFPVGYRLPAPRVTALPPEMQREVQARLAELPVQTTPEQRQAKEAEFTASAIRSKTLATRVLTGVGSNASPYHREMVGIAREVRDLGAKYDQLQQDLSEVVRYETVTDPATGEPKPVPVYRVGGVRAQAYAAQQQDILRRIRLLVQDDGTHGIEAGKRLRQALHESAVARQKLQQQVEERAEAKRRADEINRERRINAQAQSLASVARSTF